MTRRLAIALTVLLLGWTAGPAEAHIVASRLGDFYAGALHPLTDLNDIVLWLALALLGGSLGRDRGRWLVLAFPLGLLVGLLSALSLGASFGGTVVAAAGMVVLGLLLAAGARMPAGVLVGLAAAIAVTRGIANSAGAGPETNLPAFAAGFVLTGYAVVTLTTALTVLFRGGETAPAWRPIALRACGSWVAAIGLMVGGLALAS